jgi:hypothetical protein
VKTLVEHAHARRRRQPRPHYPYRDRELLLVDEEGLPTAASLTRKQALLDLHLLSQRLESEATFAAPRAV